jgi:predicted RNA-binding Zn-ribbon protein involved in translation (DUF1610 family)
MSAARRTVGAMRNQVQTSVEHDVLDEPCPRCGSTTVRVVVTSSFHAIAEIESTDAAADAFTHDDPLFDCRECGFEWGELVRDLMS